MNVLKNVLIVDDEIPARNKVRRFLEDYHDQINVQEAVDGLEAIKLIHQNKWDLVILDIQMPNMNGIEVVELVGIENMPAFLFSTAYNEHAVKAFELNAIDYLLKPYHRERFFAAISRAIERFKNEAPSHETIETLTICPKQPPINRILVRENDKIFPIAVEEIILFEADDKYVIIKTATATHLVRNSLKSLENRLDPQVFIRVHRSAMINLRCLKEMQSLSHGDYTLKLKANLETTLSRKFAKKFKTLLG